MVDAAITELFEQNKVFFQREVEGLTELQLNAITQVRGQRAP